MKKKFVIQSTTNKKYYYNSIWDFHNWTDNILQSTFFDSEEEVEEAIKDDFFDGGDCVIILKVFVR